MNLQREWWVLLNWRRDLYEKELIKPEESLFLCPATPVSGFGGAIPDPSIFHFFSDNHVIQIPCGCSAGGRQLRI